MNRLATIAIWLATALSASAQADYAEGVSLSLAQHRAATISNVKYHLTFVIPEDKRADINATVTIAFCLDAPREVALDFREDSTKIHSVTYSKNGKPVSHCFVNDHIVIPKRCMRKGTNSITLAFTAGNQSLNRNDDYMYTLFVPDRARTCFPCFDQPDLKGTFALTLDIPDSWTAVANEPLHELPPSAKGRHTLTSGNGKQKAATVHKPIPTYLFAFAAGKFQHREDTRNGRTIGAYYRETDQAKTAQIDEVFRQVHFALDWLEDYTALPYPFPKYDLVILPGFQFGGMEHTGCTFYNDNSIFLTANPTDDELLRRTSIIAHETAHMWFGDLVTMRWFNDVWIKEVFANYFAAKITEPLFPDMNHEFYWLKNYKLPAVEEDRTEGRTAIQQPLDNLRNAGLIYNSIIYDKAPLVMRDMVDMMGEEAFRRGVRHYLSSYAYGNASWDDLIAMLDDETTADLRAYSDLWVKHAHYPTVTADSSRPDPTGRRYAHIQMTKQQTDSLMDYWHKETAPTARMSFLMTLNENHLAGIIDNSRWCRFLCSITQLESEPLIASTAIAFLENAILTVDDCCRTEVERQLWTTAQTHDSKTRRLQLIRFLSAHGNADDTNKQMYVLWRYADTDLLSERDYMSMAYELALRYPTLANDIITEQHGRIIDPDRQREFEYIARAVSPDSTACDSLFQWLLKPENRRIEPWAASALYYLNHPLRDTQSANYILPALEALEEVQRTGDIFFPARWCKSLLRGHRSDKARDLLHAFLERHPDYPQLLRNKILVAAYALTNNTTTYPNQEMRQ